MILIDGMAVGLIMPILPKLFIDMNGGLFDSGVSLHTRYTMYSVSLTMFPLFMLFAAPLLGSFSDFYGRKKILQWCSFLTALTYLIFTLSIKYSNVFIFILAICISGCIAGNVAIAQAAMIDVSKVRLNKLTNISLISVAGALGFIAGPLLEVALFKQNFIRELGLSAPFRLVILLSLINTAIIHFFFSETANITDKKKIPFDIIQPILLLKEGMKDLNVCLLSTVFFCGRFCWLIYFQTLSLRLNVQYHFSSEKLGILFTYIGISVFFGIMLIVPRLNKLKSIKKIAKISLFITLLFTIISGVFHNEPIQWIAISILPTAAVIFENTMLHLFSDTINEKAMGWAMGIVTSITSLCSIIAGILSGILSYYALSLPIFLGVTLGIFGLVLFLGLSLSLSKPSVSV